MLVMLIIVWKKCIAWGDPHFVQFDEKKFDYQGTCWYTMVRDRCHKINGVYLQPSFRVVAHFTTRDNPLVVPSWVKEVKIYVGSAVSSKYQ